MIYLTGDTHGPIDIRRLNTTNWPEQKALTAEDYLLITGDFGCIWDGGKEDTFWLDWLAKKPYTICFVCGNHENFDLLEQYPIKSWNGGMVHEIRPNVFHLMRGQVFNLEGQRFFTLGGASSIDKHRRAPGVSWWPQELPSLEELAMARQTLDDLNWEVDVVLTHTASHRMMQLMNCFREDEAINHFLEELEDRLTYQVWYFGHFHRDEWLDAKHRVIYRDLLKHELPTQNETDEPLLLTWVKEGLLGI